MKSNLTLPLKLKALAKINIFLNVIDQRSDGYHNIETLFLPLEDLYDEISVTVNNLTLPQITSNSDIIPLDKDNICYQAALEFAKVADVEPAWDIDINKNIPVSAGLGGGSSDAGTLLRILSKKYPNVKEEDIFDIAISLGADVPFFLNPTPSIAKGIGDVITVIESIPQIELLIINPLFPVSAAWGYKNMIKSDQNSKASDVIEALQNKDFNKLNSIVTNDLEKAVFNKFPIMDIIKNDLLDFEATSVHMSGSGPTLFVFSSNSRKLNIILEKIKLKYENSIFATFAKTVASI